MMTSAMCQAYLTFYSDYKAKNFLSLSQKIFMEVSLLLKTTV